MTIVAGYSKPDARIIQEVTSPSITNADPDLYTCVVGMCYQIIKDSSAGTYDGTSTLYAYPGIIDEAVIDTDSVIVKVAKGGVTNTLPATNYTAGSTGVTLNDAIYIERELPLATGTLGDSTAGGTTFTDSAATFITWGIMPGDILTISSVGSNAGDYTIASVTSETEIILISSLVVTQSNIDYSMTHVDYIGNGLGATVFVGYRALRTDLDGVHTVNNSDDASAQLGYLLPANPLGYGVLCSLNNTNAKVKYIAVTADTLAQHTLAAETLESHEVYSIAPMTFSTAIIGMWRTHVSLMSVPAEKKERRVLACRQLALRSVRVESTDGVITDQGGSIYRLTREGAVFITNGTLNGDRLYFSSVGETTDVSLLTSYAVRDVAEAYVDVYSSIDISGTEAVFTVTSQTFTKDQQAEHIRDFASSIESSRVTLIWPPYTTASPDGTSELVEGYFIAASLAGAISALPAQQGFTNLKLSGFDRLSFSNLGYFRDSQLDTMASGGVMIFTQTTTDSLIQCRHQLTTNMSAIEYRELSIVKNVDYIAKLLRARVRPFIGIWNITSFFKETLKVMLQGTFEDLKVSDDIAGPNITSATIVTLEENTTSPDRIDIVVDLGIPYPANDIRITLRI